MSKENDLYKRAENDKYRLSIYHEDSPESPREWDNLAIMVCFHNNYNLGDKDHGYSKKDFDSWKELCEQIVKDHEPVVIKPVYMYDHSGITLSTGEFSCKWDSGQVGFIFVSKERCVSEYGVVNPESIERATSVLDGEFRTYNEYAKGNVYGFKLEEKIKCGECGHVEYNELDSCWGFYGNDMEKNDLIYHVELGKELLDELIKNLK